MAAPAWTSTPLRSALRLSALTIGTVNAAGFAVTATTHTHAVTDLCGTSAFVGSAWATWAAAATAGRVPLISRTRGFALTALVTAWGARLGGYLFSRVLATGGDSRLDPFFPQPGHLPIKLAGFWTAQAAWAFICMLPVTAAHATLPPAARVGLGGGSVALAAAAAALGVQAAADSQKAAWKKGHPDVPLTTGKLFATVQYPNYAAEVAFWSAVTLAAGPALVAAPWAVASPAFSALLLSRVSGVPPLEAARQKRYGHDPAYRAYFEATPRMLPRWAGGRGPGEAR